MNGVSTDRWISTLVFMFRFASLGFMTVALDWANMYHWKDAAGSFALGMFSFTYAELLERNRRQLLDD